MIYDDRHQHPLQLQFFFYSIKNSVLFSMMIEKYSDWCQKVAGAVSGSQRKPKNINFYYYYHILYLCLMS